ncbi:MAG: tyrosine-type recombinase/integrase [Candidatus Pristimantibacillus sp.]
MNTVQPITDPELIEAIKGFYRKRNERDLFLFIFGTNIGLRITDMICRRVREVRGKDEVAIREGKTGKEKLIPINPWLKQVISQYTKGMKPDDFLFPSRQRDKHGLPKHITRERAYLILREAADHFGLERIGCHSLRKTYGYFLYEKEKDVALLMYVFNHSTEKITMRYIGKNQESFKRAMKGFRV